MKPYQFLLGLLAGACLVVFTASTTNLKPNTQYEFTQVTVIESVVPAGMGRSRMITDFVENIMWRITASDREILAQIGDGKAEEPPLAKHQRNLTALFEGINALTMAPKS